MDIFPKKPATKSFWHTDLSDLADCRTTPDLPNEADVVIIGSGFSAASAAYYLLKSPESRPSTIILEARQVCSGATGRNGGHLKPFTYAGWNDNVRKYGLQVAAQISNFLIKQLVDTKALIEEENIDCDFILTRAMDVYTDASHAGPMCQDYIDMVKSGLVNGNDIYPMLTPSRAEELTGVKGAQLAFSFTTGSLWPYKLICHLLRRAIEWGANLQTNTPVISISEKPGKDGRWVISTDRGEIKAEKIIVTTNGYISSLLPEFKSKIVPVRGIVVRIAVPEGKKAPLLTNTYTIKYGAKEYDYLMPRPDGSIVVGGAKQEVLKDEAYWYGNGDDSEMVPGGEEYFQGYMQRMFTGWENSDAQITHKWTGVMGYSSDVMPWVGELPERKGIFVSAGFTGSGMPRILGCARAVAELAKGSVEEIKHTAVPKPWWISQERLQSKVNMIKEYMAGSKELKQKL